MRKPRSFGGRPRKTPMPHEGARVHLGFRVTPELKRRLEEMATRTGRSQSQEAERRLEMSFEWERALGGFEEWKTKHGEELKAIELGNYQAALHRGGWQRVHTPKGNVWVEPGVPPVAADGISRSGFITPETGKTWEDVGSLEEVIELAVQRAIEATGIKSAA